MSPKQRHEFLASIKVTVEHAKEIGLLTIIRETDRLTKPPLRFQPIDAPTERILDAVRSTVANHYHISLDEMDSHARPERLSMPRSIAVFLACELSGASYRIIGKAFHRTGRGALWLHERCSDRIVVDKETRRAVKMLVDEVRGRCEQG
jgi:chromosomal replication initiation ATPase DnaA